MEENEDIGSVLFIDWTKNSKLFSFFSKKTKKHFQMVKFTTILLSMGNDQGFISDQLGISLNWTKHVQGVTKFSPHVRVIQRKEYFISAIDLIV